MRRGQILVWALLVGLALPVHAQRPSGWVGVEGFYHRVTNDFGDWTGGAIRIAAPAGAADVWLLEGLVQEAFGDRGVYGAVANRHQFGASWFTVVGVGGGTGDFVFPDLRADLSVGRAFGQIVAVAGGTYVNSKQGFENVTASGSLVLYLPGVAIEGGGRVNWSHPGNVRTERAFGAVTLGRDRHRFVVIRGSGGYEGYQLTGPGMPLRRFRSHEVGVAWREWLGGGIGLTLGADWYDNPFYTRTGVSLGIFRHW